MNLRKIFRRTLAALLIVAGLLTAAVTHAEIQTYTGEGAYVMSEDENLGVAKERAKADAMRNAQEQAGIFIRSYSKMKNFKLIDDEIITIASNIIKLVKEPQYYPLEAVANLDGVLIKVTVVANIDSDDLNTWLNKSDLEKQTLIAQNKDLRRQLNAQAEELAALKRRLAESTTEQDKTQIAQQFAAEDKIFLSNQKVSEGWQLYYRKDFGGAIKLHSEAIELNPYNALAYYGRAYAYDELKNYPQAIADCTKAVQFDSPCLVDAYNNRGEAYRKSGNYHAAIADYNKALELNSAYVKAYNNRGNAYLGLNQYERAIQDYDKAIELNPDYALAYYNRGLTYHYLNQYERAIQDYDKAIELNPNDDAAYNNRGWTYYCLKQYRQALKDFDKTLEINPNHTLAKNNRDACLKAMGK